MNASLQELYKQTLLKHSKDATHHRELADATHRHTLRNRLCGDEITVSVSVADGAVLDLAYRAQCCSICAASASMLAHLAEQQPVERLSDTARSLIHSLNTNPPPAESCLGGDLEALNGVRSFPSRVRCATLPWESFLAAVRP